jgi:hypothetical protein
MGSCFVRIDDVSCVGVDVSSLCVAFFCPGGEHVEGISDSIRGYARGIHEALNPLVEDVQRLSLVSHVSIVQRFFGIDLCRFEGF